MNGEFVYESVLEQDVFLYLDVLRESGVTNMFGAQPYIVNEFQIEGEAAKELLLKWMRTFSERHPR